MKNKLNLNLDKLEVCYTAAPDVYEDLKNTKYQELDGFRIYSIEDNGTKESYLNIEIQIPDKDGVLEWERFGTLKVGSTFVDEDTPLYVWIRVDNRMLYTPIACCLYYIADTLSLRFNNITKLDIAIDGNTNYFVRIKKAVRNMELVPIVLGRAYPEKSEIIKKLLYLHTADREKYRTNTISVSASDKDFALAVYNKTDEIEESNKSYISEWDGLDDTIYRVEVRLRRPAIRDYLNVNGVTFEDVYLKLFDKDTQFNIFRFYSDRLLRFRSGRETISILQL